LSGKFSEKEDEVKEVLENFFVKDFFSKKSEKEKIEEKLFEIFSFLFQNTRYCFAPRVHIFRRICLKSAVEHFFWVISQNLKILFQTK